MTLTRFDKIVLVSLAGLLLLTGSLARYSERRGVTIVKHSPAWDAEDVSTRSDIRVSFDQAMDIAQLGAHTDSALPLPFALQPDTPGSFHWSNNTCIFRPSVPLEPESSYTVTLAETLRSLQGRSLQGESQWRFRTRKPALLYLAPDSNGIMQINMLDPDTGPAQRLTQAASDVRDYALSPDAATIVYSLANEQQGHDLWLLDLASRKPSRLLACKQEECSYAVWSPDGSRLIYERSAADSHAPRLWWVDVKSGESIAVFDDVEHYGFGPALSPDGAWLSSLDPIRREIRLYRSSDGRRFDMPNQLEFSPVWNPRKNLLLFSDGLFKGEALLSHLFLADPERGELRDLSGEEEFVNDRFPAWSSDGKWIAFSRKISGTRMGLQLGLMGLDDTEAFALTGDPAFSNTHPAWSPDDRDIAFQRTAVEDLTNPPEIWLVDSSNGQSRQVVSSGRQPNWLP